MDERMSRVVWLLLFGLLATGCQQASPEARSLVVTGSATVAPLLREMGKQFESSHAGVRITVLPGTSDRGVTEARQGLADIGMVARPLRGDETTLHAFPLASDGIAILVHKSNPVASLSEEQIVGLYTRSITSWQKIAKIDRPVIVIGHGESHAIRDLFLEHFHLKTSKIEPHQIVANSAQVITAVANRPGAIAYASLGPALAAVASGQPIRLLPLGGVPATMENVRSGKYPLARSLILVTREAPTGLTEEFLTFARSPDSQELIRQHGFAPLAP
jgi:phosphate transport system substrate-binding protein